MSKGKRTYSVDEMLREIDQSPENVAKIRALRETIESIARKHRSYSIPSDGRDTLKFAVLGDTHIGSMYHRADALRAFYERAKEWGADFALHAGDVLAGWHVYKGQEFELRDQGFDAQVKRFASEYPKVGMRTYFITGNHDSSFKKLVGVSVGDVLADARKDCVFIGEDEGKAVFTTKTHRDITVSLVHPDGGTAYALSYRPQRIVESISGGQKPNLLCIGHFHKAELIPSYRNMCAIQTGTFESQTPFMVRKGSAAHVGGWLVEMGVGKPGDLSQSVKAQFIAFFEDGK